MNKTVIFDLDGTIYFGNDLAPYTLEVLNSLKEDGYKIIFFTNNSSKLREGIFNKLVGLGIDTDLSSIYTSSYATAIYLSQNNIKRVFPIGSEDFKIELENFNISIVSEHECEAVVVGLDIAFNYDKIAKALTAINNGAKLIASNIDANFLAEKKILKPASNAIVSSITGCSGKEVDYIVGKPNTFFLEIIVNELNLDRNNIWVVGDSLESDITMANNYGCKSFLVHTNNKSLKDFVNHLKEEEKA